MKLFGFGFVLFILSSCDTSTHEYYSFVKNKNSTDQIQVYYSELDDSGIIVSNDSIIFDNVEITFYNDSSKCLSYREKYYSPIYDSSRTQIDSVLQWQYKFDFQNFEQRIKNNDSVFAQIRLGKEIVIEEVLYQDIFTTEFIDRLPIPRLH